MIYAKTTTYGLDTKIKQIQQALQDDLPWFDVSGMQDTDIAIYGKVYTNVDDKNRPIPEAYKSGNEYTQIFVNDKIACTIGFILNGNRVITNGKNTTSLDIVCTLNLDRIYGVNERDDEKALIEFKKVLMNDNTIQVFNEVKETVPVVFEGFYYDNIKFNDMQPWYVFSLNVDVEYFSDYCAPTYS